MKRNVIENTLYQEYYSKRYPITFVSSRTNEWLGEVIYKRSVSLTAREYRYVSSHVFYNQSHCIKRSIHIIYLS